MNDRDFNLVMRAKRQIRREASWRSFLLIGLIFAAVLRLLGYQFPLLYGLIFVLFLVSLVLSSDLIANIGTVSKKDLLSIIESHIHSDPDMLSRYAQAREKR